ncbi:MAG: hypothetical protein HY000_24470 [Planctomycetes bacterium]|nr:hypothetical protein [Planctomycetota bacterium]
MKATAIGTLLGLILLVAADARAAISMRFDGFVPPALGVTIRDGAIGTHATSAGLLNWTILPGGDLAAGTLQSYCIDIFQDIDFGQTVSDYSISQLESSPVYAPGGFMTADRANSLRELVTDVTALHGSPFSFSSSILAAGFQLAVWEIVFEDDLTQPLGGTLSLSNGDFKVTSGSSAAVSQANAFLALLNGSSSSANVLALTSPTAQDVAVLLPTTVPWTGAVPEPASLLSWSVLGLIGLGWRRLRRVA